MLKDLNFKENIEEIETTLRYNMLNQFIQNGRVIEPRLISTSNNSGRNTPYQAAQKIRKF